MCGSCAVGSRSGVGVAEGSVDWLCLSVSVSVRTFVVEAVTVRVVWCLSLFLSEISGKVGCLRWPLGSCLWKSCWLVWVVLSEPVCSGPSMSCFRITS